MEDMSLPRLSVSIPMIGRILLLVLNIIVIGIIGYYFAYYRGSFRQNLFDEELMMLVCAVSAFINTVIMVMVAMTSSYHQSGSSLQTSYAELISNGVSAFLLIIAGMVLLIQVVCKLLLFLLLRDVFIQSNFRCQYTANISWLITRPRCSVEYWPLLMVFYMLSSPCFNTGKFVVSSSDIFVFMVFIKYYNSTSHLNNCHPPHYKLLVMI